MGCFGVFSFVGRRAAARGQRIHSCAAVCSGRTPSGSPPHSHRLAGALGTAAAVRVIRHTLHAPGLVAGAARCLAPVDRSGAIGVRRAGRATGYAASTVVAPRQSRPVRGRSARLGCGGGRFAADVGGCARGHGDAPTPPHGIGSPPGGHARRHAADPGRARRGRADESARGGGERRVGQGPKRIGGAGDGVGGTAGIAPKRERNGGAEARRRAGAGGEAGAAGSKKSGQRTNPVRAGSPRPSGPAAKPRDARRATRRCHATGRAEVAGTRGADDRLGGE